MAEVNYATNGKGNLGVTLGAIGTGLGVLGNGLGNVLGGWGNNARCGCNEDHMVNRYDLGKDQEIAKLETKIALLEANTYNDQKSLELYKYVDGKFNAIESQIAQQAVYNATNTSTINCLANQIAQLQSLTKVVIPTASICPEPMARYNSWTAPTATPSAT